MPSRSLFGSGLTILVVALLVVKKRRIKKGLHFGPRQQWDHPIWQGQGVKKDSPTAMLGSTENWAPPNNDEVDFGVKARTSAELF